MVSTILTDKVDELQRLYDRFRQEESITRKSLYGLDILRLSAGIVSATTIPGERMPVSEIQGRDSNKWARWAYARRITVARPASNPEQAETVLEYRLDTDRPHFEGPRIVAYTEITMPGRKGDLKVRREMPVIPTQDQYKAVEDIAEAVINMARKRHAVGETLCAPFKPYKA